MGKTRDLFEKIRDTKGPFHAKMGTIKDRNSLDLEKQKKLRSGKNTQNCRKKILMTRMVIKTMDHTRWCDHSPRTRHSGMWSQEGLRKHHYEQNEWRWWNSSGAISNPKKWCCESAATNMPANLENSAVATGLEKVSFHSNPKERQCQRMLKLLHNCPHLTR